MTTSLLKKARLLGNRIHQFNLRWYIQRKILRVQRREAIARRIANRRPRFESFACFAADEKHVTALESDGITHLGRLIPAAQVDRIVAALAKNECYDDSGRFLIDTAPGSCRLANYSEALLVNCPHLLEIANNPSILAVCARVLGCKPTISNMSAWWSLPGHKAAEHAQLFHRDVDDWKFIKLFVYLTDVDENAGPHVYVRRSHQRDVLLPYRVARFTDDEVKAVFPESDILKLTGKAGDAFLANTYGIHKGLLPLTRRRLLFQVQYSLSPIGVYRYSPRPVPGAAFDPYINRLYVAPNAAATTVRRVA
jgi:hypothetical protein